jgi:lysophospholipase L1-like esterase
MGDADDTRGAGTETPRDATAESAESAPASTADERRADAEKSDAQKESRARETAKSIAALIVVLLLLELVVRVVFAARHAMVEYVALPYVMGGDFGPQPPWADGERMRVHDEDLFWRGRPDFEQRYVNLFTVVESDEVRRAMIRRFSPAIPDAFKGNPTWRVKLDHDGFRGDALGPKAPGALRVVCLGDSWTFGASVDQDASYPAQLETQLTAKYPGKKLEVKNLGIIGHSSFQGVKLLRTAMALDPDVLVIAYAMNERHWAGYKSSDPVAAPRTPLFAHSELYKLLKYWAQSISWKPKPMGDLLRWEAGQRVSLEAFEDEGELEDWMQRSLADYDANVMTMMKAARDKKVDVVLVYPEFWVDGPYGRAARRVSQREGVPLVDVSKLIADERARRAYEVESKLGLRPDDNAKPGGGDKVEIVMRVRKGARGGDKPVFVAGPYAEWGELAPNTVELYDDGTHGDQRAGDGVWSRAFSMPKGKPLYYVWTSSGERGAWTGLDVPVLRDVKVPATYDRARYYAPIDTFGEMPLYGDPWHTDAEGNGLVAKDLLRALGTLPRVTSFVAR